MEGTAETGERTSWEVLAARSPLDVARDAAAVWNPSDGAWTIRTFGRELAVSPLARSVRGASPDGDALLASLGTFFRLSVLWYLAHAKDVPATGRLVRPQDIRGGHIFAKGAHILPLDSAARRWGSSREGFLERGRSIGGEEVRSGDAAVRIYPLPRVPVTLVLWLADDEFPARMDLFFDSTCELQAATDVLWSLAIMSLGMMD